MRKLLTISLLAVVVWSPQALAEKDDVLTLITENDVIAGSDRHYTSGILLSYVGGLNSGPRRAENLGRRLPMIKEDDLLHVGLSIGHEIYTPRDIGAPTLIDDDRPYAGYAYAAADFTVSDERALSNWRLALGIVGPSARAEQIQSDLHERIDSDVPRGWEHQLEDEFAYSLHYDKQWRPLCDSQCRGWGADILPNVGFALGNVNSYLAAGATLRVGRNLGADYGPPLIRPALPGSLFFSPSDDSLSWYFYLGLNGRYVGQNIFLDGNTDKDSHAVDRRDWVGDVQIGFVVNTANFRISYSHVVRTKEFDDQRRHNRFGSLTLAVKM